MNTKQTAGLSVLIICINSISRPDIPIPILVLGAIGSIVGVSIAILYSDDK